eukprot:9804037-Alexandrium_andersonii.AAC.1
MTRSPSRPTTRRPTSAGRGRAWSASGQGWLLRSPPPHGGGIGLPGLAPPFTGGPPPVGRAARRGGGRA